MSKCKYQLLAEEISTDGGVTWTRTGNTRKGALIEFGSNDCSMRIDATLSNGTTAQIPCTSTTYTSSAISRSEVTSISNYQLMTDVEIGGCVSSVGSGAFSATSLSSVTVEEGVTTIQGQAFRYCPNMKRVDLPSTLTSIANYAFQIPTGSTATQWDTMIVRATTPPTIYSSTIQHNNSAGVPFRIFVPDASVDTYKSANIWSNFSSNIKALSTLT